jgi:hypothetical protein
MTIDEVIKRVYQPDITSIHPNYIVDYTHQLAAEVRRLREHERVLVEALAELMCIVKIHSNNNDNDFAWAEMSQARAALEAVKEATDGEA